LSVFIDTFNARANQGNIIMEIPLFHYTNQAGLRGIIESRSLWFTDIFFLNDATEFQYALTLIQEELSSKIELAELDESSDNCDILRVMEASCDYRMFNELASLYVFLLTIKPDDLSHWANKSSNVVRNSG
jgi:hypothetical protein